MCTVAMHLYSTVFATSAGADKVALHEDRLTVLHLSARSVVPNSFMGEALTQHVFIHCFENLFSTTSSLMGLTN